jgi:hypothetical protein
MALPEAEIKGRGDEIHEVCAIPQSSSASGGKGILRRLVDGKVRGAIQ